MGRVVKSNWTSQVQSKLAKLSLIHIIVYINMYLKWGG